MRSMRCVGPSWGWYMVWGGWWRSMVRSWWGMMRSHWSMVMRGWRMAEVGWRNRVSISAWWTVISGVLEVIMWRQTMMRMASMVCMAMVIMRRWRSMTMSMTMSMSMMRYMRWSLGMMVGRRMSHMSSTTC